MKATILRIDLAWAVTYEAGGFIWAYDIKTDNTGNTYSTGYFQRNLKIKDKIYIENHTGGRSNTCFLMKHDDKGKLVWIRYEDNISSPSKIFIDNTKGTYIPIPAL